MDKICEDPPDQIGFYTDKLFNGVGFEDTPIKQLIRADANYKNKRKKGA